MTTFFCNSVTNGMNEIIDPSLLDKNTAALLVNADPASGKVRSIKTPQILNIQSPEALQHYGGINRSTVKFYERTYWSVNNAMSPPYYGGDKENFLGVPYPDYTRDVTISKTDGSLTGKYKYCVTFVTLNGWESAPGSITEYEKSITFDNQCAIISVQWSDRKIKYAKVYRTAEHGADFYCVGEILNPGQSLTDTIDDYTLTGLSALDSIDNYPPPDGGKFLCESGGVFFLAVDSTLYFSAPGNPHAWPLLNFVGMDDVITGIVPEFQGVLVFTANNSFRITGADNLDTITKSLLPGNQGCIKYSTIAQISNAPVWLSNDGICLWNGESITVVSKQIMNTTRRQVICAASANDCYYLFLADSTIVYNHRYGDVFSKLDFSCDYAWYDANRDMLFLQNDKEIYLFDAGSKAQYTYLSGYIGMPESEFQYLEELIISIEGTATVKLLTESRTVFEVNLTSGGRHRIQTPYNTIAKYAQIKVSGVGTLDEIVLTYR